MTKEGTDDTLGLINGFTMKCTLGTEEGMCLTSCFHVLDVANKETDGILLKEGQYYRIGLIYDTIKEYILRISIGAYDKVNYWGKNRRGVLVNGHGYVDEN